MQALLVLWLSLVLKARADQYDPSPASKPGPAIIPTRPQPASAHPSVQAAAPGPAAAQATLTSLSRTLVSFSIESDRWVEWAGSTSANTFNYNILSNLAKLTGQPPNIRVGADSEDHTDIDNSVDYSYTVFPNYTTTTPYPEASTIRAGKNYYLLSKWLPSGTRMTWGVNFGQNNLTAAFLESKAIVAAFKDPSVVSSGVILDHIEIGNEADLYKYNGLRPASTWTPAQYVKEWTAFAANVSAATGMTRGGTPSFMALSYAGSDKGTNGFSPQNAYAAGLLTSTPGGLITHVSQHRYSGSFCQGSAGLLKDLMAKAYIRGNITVFSADIAATEAKNLKYVLGETNSYSCHGAPGVSNTAGAALWALDYVLQAAVNHVKEVYFHHGVGYKYNFYQPVTLDRSITDGSPLPTPIPPHIQPTYYSAIIANELIGNKGTSGIVELNVSDARVAAYVVYEGSTPARAVIINSDPYIRAGSSFRLSINVVINGVTSDPNALMTVKRLKIGFADDTSGVTWGGQTYETSDGLVSGTLVTERVPVSGGVNVTSTEAVLLSFI